MKTLLTKMVPVLATSATSPIITILTALATGYEAYTHLKGKEEHMTDSLDTLADKLTDIFERF